MTASNPDPKLPWPAAHGENYGARVNAILATAAAQDGFRREDWLKLAWAALDHGATRATMPEIAKALRAIESLLSDAEEP